MSIDATQERPIWGFVGFICGTIALIIVVLHVSAVFVEPQQSAAMTIGEIAGEIRNAAKRTVLGLPRPEAIPEPVSWNVDQYLKIIGPILGGLAAIIGAVGLLQREPSFLPKAAIAFGVSAFVMQYVFWLALLIGGICLLVAIINNMDGILGG